MKAIERDFPVVTFYSAVQGGFQSVDETLKCTHLSDSD